MSTVAIVVLVVWLCANLAGWPQMLGLVGGQTGASLPMHLIAAAIILLLVTSRSSPQPRSR